jgi:uncharacterized delta-60 repeat protein
MPLCINTFPCIYKVFSFGNCIERGKYETWYVIYGTNINLKNMQQVTYILILEEISFYLIWYGLKNKLRKQKMKSYTNLLMTLFLFCAILVSSNTFAQTQEWLQRYNGTGNSDDGYEAVARDNAGNVYVGGMTTVANIDYLIVKYNSSGTEQWSRAYSGPGSADDFLFDIAVDASGNVYVTGGSIGTDYDFATIKYNSSGTPQWIQRYNGTGNAVDIAYSIAVDASGNVYVGGISSGTGSSSDYVTIKYNSSGIEQWVQRYNGPANGFDNLGKLILDASANVYVTGISTGSGSLSDAATIKYNSSGSVQWIARYNGPGNAEDEGNDLGIDAAGNVYTTGRSKGLGTGYDCYVVKYNSVGTQQWVQRYNGTGNGDDQGYRIAVDGSGNSVLTGSTSSNGNKILTIKYNSGGAERWTNIYSGSQGGDRGFAITMDNGGNVYVGGQTYTGPLYTDCILIKYSSTGVQQFLQTYEGPAAKYDAIYDIAVDPSGANVYAAGYSDGNGTLSDGILIKYSQLTGVQNTTNEIPTKFSLKQNYPNPFNPSTKIEFNLPESGNVKLEVFDITGKMVSELVDGTYNAGSYSVNFDANGISAGVYYYRIQFNGISEVKKMMLIK